MFPKSFSDFTFYQKKKDILIYKAADSNHQYILKCSENTTPALKQALLDEYEGLSPLSHPSLPKYYGFCENFSLPLKGSEISTDTIKDTSDDLERAAEELRKASEGIKYSCLCALYGVL